MKIKEAKQLNQQNRKVIIGLGNPGDEYKSTRHNTGFMYIDYLLNKHRDKQIKEKKLKNSSIYEVGDDLVFVKPQTFMNESGLAVREVIKWLEVDIEKELVLVHDDLDIPLGKYKFQFAKSPKDHKGVKSVEKHLGTIHFHRLRIGVDNREGKHIDTSASSVRSGERYVLENFKEEELVCMREIFESINSSERLK